MSNPFRDTQLGSIVRFLSRTKILLYPDEINPTGCIAISKRSNSPLSKEPNDQQTPLAKEIDETNTTQHCQPVSVPSSSSPVLLVDWYGPDDPENPQNFPTAWKLLIVFQICLLNFAVYLGSSIYVPGEAGIMAEFGCSEEVATLGLSLFSAGYGLGPMLWSPMSEIPSLGRTSIYIFTLLGFVLLQLPTGFASNMPMFLVFRLLTGFLGSPSLATGGATIMDIYDPGTASYWICIYASFGVLGPVFGPIIGAYIAPAKGWRWTIWICTILCAGVWVLMVVSLPETSAANILHRRAKRLRQSLDRATTVQANHEGGGEDSKRSIPTLILKAQSEIDAAHYTTRDHIRLLTRAFTLTFFEPIVFFADLYTALLYGVLFLWFESFPLVFGDTYHFSPQHQGLVFLGIFVGLLITVPGYLLWLRYYLIPRFAEPGGFKPEWILPPTFLGAVALPVCLFWYGWSAREEVQWILPIVGSGFFTVGVVTIFNCVLNYLGLSYPNYAASIFAGNALFRASFGAIFPLFARQLFRKLGVGPGNSLLGAIAVCFIPVPYIFYKHGHKIRHISRNARHDI